MISLLCEAVIARKQATLYGNLVKMPVKNGLTLSSNFIFSRVLKTDAV